MGELLCRNGTKSWYVWWNLPTNPAVFFGLVSSFNVNCWQLLNHHAVNESHVKQTQNTKIDCWVVNSNISADCVEVLAVQRPCRHHGYWLNWNSATSTADGVYSEAPSKSQKKENHIGWAKLLETVKANYLKKKTKKRYCMVPPGAGFDPSIKSKVKRFKTITCTKK